MAKEIDVQKVLEEAGYTPLENRSIIVTYAAPNLSAKIANFFSNDFYILNLCENAVVLVPFGSFYQGYPLQKEVALEIPTASIQSVRITENGLNYDILIETDDSQLTLSTQQKELSDFRSAGSLAFDWGKGLAGTNWHKTNLDPTLQMLTALAQ